ncbi:hypothetical protein GGE45_003299 [Rhizobium aethiopicum]|uniref:DUF5801 domain-containing protein n=1 Tax=Rhizobium aethiopicum TaxID=1138170 RepID=A0A7W6QAF9_9HYPH|nr:DUF5801 repeats-in-toxin domain-containing protein [Rhizobium aethiopicum]MBB4193535.1 hypothetical protein [Rhizobium aethiopicum]MBB4580959.1 hypothetical protein [Rhizobium aethiopicum]
MALDITTQDLIIDETTGLQDDDVNPAIAPHNNATVQYLLSRDAAGGLTSPEVAYQSNFVVASASAGETITSVVLTQNASGTPYSTTVGVNSNIRTVDGKYVWLFQDAMHANVVIGVIGTSDPLTAPAAGGPLAFSLALLSTSATNADLYTVQYVPLLHPDVNNADDRIDLANKVFASVTGTTVVNFSQLGDAPSGHNNWYILDADAASPQKILVTAHDNGVQAEVNVSTQGLGVASQDVREGRELQIDLITGGIQSAGKSFTDTPTAPDYGSHIENVSSAGFSVSQSTPTSSVADMEIHAYNNNDNIEGSSFPTDDNDTEINITGVTFKLNGVATTAAALGITVDLSGTGLILRNVGEGVTVDFATAGGAGGTFDRFTIKNIDAGHDYFDVKEVHFSGDVSNAYNEEVGSFINFDDDGPTITATGTPPQLIVDETNLTTNASADFSTFFTSNAGADGGAATAITYALGINQGNNVSGLTDTATGQSVLLFLEGGSVVGRAGSAAGPVVFTVSVSTAGVVSLDQQRAIVHANASDPDDSRTLAAANLVTLTATITDGDGDHAAATHNIGQNLNFEDDGPIIGIKGGGSPLTVDETDLTTNVSAFGPAFVAFPGADGVGNGITYALGINPNNNVSGLTDTETGQSVLLFLENGSVVGRAGAGGPVVFTVSVSAANLLTLDQQRAIIHADASNPDDSRTLAAADLITLTATITDGDGDQATSTRNIGQDLNFEDDGPTITKPFDGNPATLAIEHETLANVLNASASGNFGYNIGADIHPAAFYASGSDFVDQDLVTNGVQIGLTGTITGGGGGSLLSSNVTLASESLTSATFNFTFTYDKDPAAGSQVGTAGGTLVFDKVADTYTINLTDPLEGFSFDVLHTSELLSKQPTSNTGHPQIVVEKLQADVNGTPADEDFYVQFTGNLINKANPFRLTTDGEGSSNDSTFTVGGHEMVSNNNETWVSATQSTNGVAGDTIQKDELLTLRFFNSDVGIVNEALTPTATAGAMAIKFDGIGNSEDLMLILDLIDGNGSAITRAMYVSNADIYKAGQVPAPYSSEFTLDNNDGLVIVEQNDYNAAGETYVLQGVQIMQSGNGITGDATAIDLIRATGANGGSNATANLVNFDTTDNDVLKITDIGFTSTVTQTPDANLDFAFNVVDADGDQTAMQHILVDVA